MITVSNDEIPDPILLKVMKNGNKEKIPSQGEPRDVMESELPKPKDKIYRLTILNKTGNIEDSRSNICDLIMYHLTRRTSETSARERLKLRDNLSSSVTR